jgi:uncharacterized membrane protein
MPVIYAVWQNICKLSIFNVIIFHLIAVFMVDKLNNAYARNEVKRKVFTDKNSRLTSIQVVSQKHTIIVIDYNIYGILMTMC